jgi:hypothetical protein
MKTKHFAKTRVSGPIILASLLALGSSAHAVLVDVQFLGDQGEFTGTQYTGAAVIGTDTDFWNATSAASASMALNGVDNAASGISLNFTSSNQWGNLGSGFSSTTYANLMAGYLCAVDPDTYHIAFSGLAPNASYELYIYTQGDSGGDGRVLDVSVNGAADVITSPGDAALDHFVAGTNYLHITGTADLSGVVDIAYRSAVGATGEADINGVQLSTVPEPSSLALFGVGALACMRRSRRR